jgi:dTDP-4-amino-4,6-dideoxygalactose transaminase
LLLTSIMQRPSSKSRLEDLAILGGVPAFAEPLHVGRPNIGDRERLMARIVEILDDRWLTNHGPKSQELEGKLAEFVGAKHCILTSNATAGLEVAIRALGLSGEVIVPSFTFVATAHALRWLGITPVFADVDPETHNLDPTAVEKMISPRTTGILGVHLWGRPCNIQALSRIAQRHGLKLLFDAAHALGCSYQGRMIGNHGDAEVFSFHATKICNSFEGGAVVTNDDQLAAKVRLMTNFGFADYDTVTSLGTNAKMNEVSAAMGLTSLESYAPFVAANRLAFEEYRDGLVDLPGISLIRYSERETPNFHYVVLQIDPGSAGLTRDQLQDILRAENVLARRYFFPGVHRMQPYRSDLTVTTHTLSTTESLCERVLCLPTGSTLRPDQIRMICHIIRLAVKHAPAIRNHPESQPLDALSCP